MSGVKYALLSHPLFAKIKKEAVPLVQALNRELGKALRLEEVQM